ncbi:hypothetical protein ACFL38_03950 [Candidatus Omnitrophota bacterium]
MTQELILGIACTCIMIAAIAVYGHKQYSLFLKKFSKECKPHFRALGCDVQAISPLSLKAGVWVTIKYRGKEIDLGHRKNIYGKVFMIKLEKGAFLGLRFSQFGNRFDRNVKYYLVTGNVLMYRPATLDWPDSFDKAKALLEDLYHKSELSQEELEREVKGEQK